MKSCSKNSRVPIICWAIILLWSACSARTSAQLYGNVWTFGDHEIMKFINGEPVLDTTCSIYAFEAGATISDPISGELLLYSDGRNLWNAHHQLVFVPDSLRGDPSVTQGALILPCPQNPKRFYLFTLDYPILPTLIVPPWGDEYIGLTYTTIDIDKEQEVVVEKQISLSIDTLTEQMAATIHANGHDYWLICHRWNSNEFEVWLVTNAGVDYKGKQAIGTVHFTSDRATLNGAQGELRLSPDGSKLCSIYTKGVVA